MSIPQRSRREYRIAISGNAERQMNPVSILALEIDAGIAPDAL